VEGGVVGGDIHSVPTPEPPPPPPPPKPEPEVVTIARDEPLPVQSIDQEFPPYPQDALLVGWEDQLVVQYTIEKDGTVSKISVITPPQRDEFTRTTLKTMRHWKFKPYIGRDGQARELTHQLTVQFKIAHVQRH
jgi:TonB family protein